MSKKDFRKNIEYELEIEEKDSKNPSIDGYDYVYRLNNLVSLDEHKLKVEELENITKIKKKK